MLRKINERKNVMLEMFKRLKSPKVTLDELDKIEAEIMLQYIKMPAAKGMAERIKEYFTQDPANKLEKIQTLRIAVGEPLNDLFYISREARDEIWEIARELETTRLDYLSDPSKKAQFIREQGVRDFDRRVNEGYVDPNSQVTKAYNTCNKYSAGILQMIFKHEKEQDEDFKNRKEIERRLTKIKEMYEPRGAARSLNADRYIPTHKPTESMIARNENIRKTVRLDLLSKMRKLLIRRREEIKQRPQPIQRLFHSLDKPATATAGSLREVTEETRRKVKKSRSLRKAAIDDSSIMVEDLRSEAPQVESSEESKGVRFSKHLHTEKKPFLKSSASRPVFLTELSSQEPIHNGSNPEDSSSFAQDFPSFNHGGGHTVSTLENSSKEKQLKKLYSAKELERLHLRGELLAEVNDVIFETENPEDSITQRRKEASSPTSYSIRNGYHATRTPKQIQPFVKHARSNSHNSSHSNRSYEKKLNEKARFKHSKVISNYSTEGNESVRLDSLLHPSTATHLQTIDNISFKAAEIRENKDAMKQRLRTLSKDSSDAFTLITFDKTRDQQSLFANPDEYMGQRNRKLSKLKVFRNYLHNRNKDNTDHNKRIVVESAGLKPVGSKDKKFERETMNRRLLDVKKVNHNLEKIITSNN